jgi:hypothetical protein
MNMDAQNIGSQICDYLRGYGRNDPQALERLANFPAWPQMAAREILSRASSLITCFSDEQLEAIAFGEVDMRELAEIVLGELQEKGGQS